MTEKNIEKLLISSALKAMKNSHSPHSKFKVGSAVLTKNGNIYPGTNVEFDAYSLTVCAERSALFGAVSNGDKEIVSVAVATSSEKFKFPCGLCRQALMEFNPNMDLILINKSKKTKRIKLNKLLPNHFKL